MADTTIEWTDATWNPVAGCSIVTAGCTNCYAMRMAARLAAMGTEKYTGLTRKSGGRAKWTGRIKLDSSSLDVPLRWAKATSDGAQSVTAAIFWLKTRGGWREAPQDHRVNVGVRSVWEYGDQELMRMIGIVDTTITREEVAQKARQVIEVNTRPSGSPAPAPRRGDGSSHLP